MVRLLVPLCALLLPLCAQGSAIQTSGAKNATVLILGGGVTGIIAARTLYQKGIKDFLIIEGRDELGGRLRSYSFANHTVELGANWVQGTQEGNGPANPILPLVKKHNVKTQFNDIYGSITYFDQAGLTDFADSVDYASDALDDVLALSGSRVDKKLVDISGRSAYTLAGAKRTDAQARATEYFLFDWEYAQTPEQSSAIAASWNNNFTYVTDQGGFSEDNLLSIDSRGFKAFIVEEAKDFVNFDKQVLLNSTVNKISYSNNGVTVTLADGSTVSGTHALCTFSLGVLQNDDVQFQPALPDWKEEALATMTMGTYTKIFLHFDQKFWFDTEMALYADEERGRYAVWQSLDHENFLPGSGIIFVTVTGDFSERIESLSDTQVKDEVLDVLRTMYPNITIPEPTEFFFPRWFSDPLYRGSYSNWPPSFFSEHHDNLRATLGKLWFAGEYTSLKYYGFLHGAYFEGLDAGNKIAACIQKKQCAGNPHVVDVTNPTPYTNIGL